ncbi:MAG: hypothetical protein C4570_04450 [Ammonifex sp.]|nr:MAG: hypothetical protein C4570_04450 [Ammonifex sp.]
MGTLFFFVIVVILVGFSVRERVRQQSWRFRASNGTRPSPLANALAYLVGVAGGIYLSISLVVDFLKVSVPGRVSLWKVELEPIAAIAIALAILQPFFLRFYHYARRESGNGYDF